MINPDSLYKKVGIQYGLTTCKHNSALRLSSFACVALPTFGLVMAYGGRLNFPGWMEAIANSTLEDKGNAIGVIPQKLKDVEIAHEGLTELHVVTTMHERKAKMASLSDGFIALPGGAGTLEEWFEVLTWAQLGFHQKPCGVFKC